jgi:hypothetical protein
MTSDDAIRVSPRSTPAGGGRRPGPRGFPTELPVLVLTVLAILVAAAVADNFDSPVAWAFVSILSASYILSRGLAKRGHGHDDGL